MTFVQNVQKMQWGREKEHSILGCPQHVKHKLWTQKNKCKKMKKGIDKRDKLC